MHLNHVASLLRYYFASMFINVYIVIYSSDPFNGDPSVLDL